MPTPFEEDILPQRWLYRPSQSSNTSLRFVSGKLIYANACGTMRRLLLLRPVVQLSVACYNKPTAQLEKLCTRPLTLKCRNASVFAQPLP